MFHVLGTDKVFVSKRTVAAIHFRKTFVSAKGKGSGLSVNRTKPPKVSRTVKSCMFYVFGPDQNSLANGSSLNNLSCVSGPAIYTIRIGRTH